MSDIAVVGSVNRDLRLPVARLPRPGETVRAGDPETYLGGKGANQAVAAARLGRRVGLLARLGTDGGGLRDELAAAGVIVDHCLTTEGVASGHAALLVDGDGENMIVVSPGANRLLTPADVGAHAEVLTRARVCLVQQEIPAETVAAAVAVAGGAGTIVVLNPAPYRPLDAGLLARVDVLAPNAGELADLVGAPTPATPDGVEELLRSAPPPARAIVVTVGAAGAIVRRGTEITRVPAPRVDAVDTVGAGDTFCGALADALVRGLDLVPAVRWAVHAAALAVTAPGAQGGMPTAERLSAFAAGRA